MKKTIKLAAYIGKQEFASLLYNELPLVEQDAESYDKLINLWIKHKELKININYNTRIFSFPESEKFIYLRDEVDELQYKTAICKAVKNHIDKPI